LKITVSRAGQTLGEYSLEELKAKLSAGTISPNDFAWHEALPTWMPVVEMLATQGEKVPEVRRIEVEGQQKAPYSDWQSDAATENQLDYLRSFGIEPKPGLTKGEASDLLDKATKDPVALQRQQELRATEYERKREEEIQFPSYFLRRLIQSAREELEDCKRQKAETKSELTSLARRLAGAEKKQALDLLNDALVDEIQAIKSEIEATKQTLEDYPSNLQDAQEELKSNSSLRSNFWKSTFSKMGAVLIDSADLIDYADTIDRLHDEFGRFFKGPTNKQISDILEALDKASPDWDKKEPHAFYATLKASFPDALRKNPARPTNPVQTAKGAGCLVLVLAPLVVPFLYYLAALFE
jgi:GYF domain 2